MTAVNPPISPRTDPSEDIARRAPFLEVVRLRHRDEPGGGRRRIRVPDPVRVAHEAGVGEVLVDDGAVADGALHGRRERERGDDTEEGEKSGGELHDDGLGKREASRVAKDAGSGKRAVST